MKLKLLFRILALITAVVLNACSGNDPEQVGFGDALIVAKTSGTQTVFGLSLHAFSTNRFNSVTAFAASQPAFTYVLVPYQNLSTDYVYETSPDSFSSSPPATGDYKFRVTFSNGDTITYTNKLAADIVLPPQIIKCGFNSTEKLVDLEWKQVENATFYNVKMYDSEGKILFVSPLFVTSRTTYTFGENSQGWQVARFPDSNVPLTIEVSSYLVESGTNGALYQATSRTVSQVTWGN